MEGEFFYAIYKGDKFIDLCDTIYQVANKLNCSINSARWLTYPAARRRAGNNHLLVFRYAID